MLAHIKKATHSIQEPASKRNLLEGLDDSNGSPIWLTLTTKRHISDRIRLRPGKIPIPHSLNTNDTVTICAITADPQRAYKNVINSDNFPSTLRKRITRVIDFTKLKAKYSQYEAQRKLFSEHDVFVADDRIINRLPKVLGKTFYKTTQKRPIPVVFQAKHSKRAGGQEKKRQKTDDDTNIGKPADIAKEIEKALSSALVSLSPSTNTAVRIGYSHWKPEWIADNVQVAVSALVEKWVPQKWKNVRSIHIKGSRTAALPIWQTDELWLENQDVISEKNAPQLIKEPPETNTAKKRKPLDEPENKSQVPRKKTKQQQITGNDEELDKQIADRKAKLKQQKDAAKKALLK